MCKSHNLIENACPCGCFHLRAEKPTRCHLNIGATQTSPPLQNRNAKGAEYEAGSTTRPGSRSRGKKNQNRDCSAGPSAALGRETHARPFRSEPPSPVGQATGQAFTRARGFAAYPRRCPLAESGTGCSSDLAPSSVARSAQAARSRRRPPSLGPAGSVQTRRWRQRPRRPSPTGPAQPPLRRE